MNGTETNFADLTLITFSEVITIIGIQVSKVTLWRWEQNNRFPKRVKLAGTKVAWRRAEVLEWLRLQLNNRDNIHYGDPR